MSNRKKDFLLAMVDMVGTIQMDWTLENVQRIFKRFNVKDLSYYEMVDKYYSKLSSDDISSLERLFGIESIYMESQIFN